VRQNPATAVDGGETLSTCLVEEPVGDHASDWRLCSPPNMGTGNWPYYVPDP
jgi:hypothetical protein